MRERSPNFRRLREIDAEIEALDLRLLKLDRKYEAISVQAKRDADRKILVFLGGWTATFIAIARLTWWEWLGLRKVALAVKV